MKSHRELKSIIPTALCLAVLILDGHTAIEGAREGLEVCLKTVLPSLFPFIFLSSMLTTWFSSGNRKGNNLLCRLYRIPMGSDGILLTGLLGGYPIGARCIGEAISSGQLSQSDGKKMLIFCNAAGPAFLFGITGSIFQEKWIPWCLWGIHLFSSLCMARLLQSSSEKFIAKNSTPTLSITQRLRQSVLVMGEICGWIILMRIAIAFLDKWCLMRLSQPLKIFATGIIELSNGCVSLSTIENTGLRFIICSTFLAFGGLCVALQTASAAPCVNQRMYLPGKFVQALISFIVAYTVQYITFDTDHKVHLPWLFYPSLLIMFLTFIYFRIKQKSCGILVCNGV